MNLEQYQLLFKVFSIAFVFQMIVIPFEFYIESKLNRDITPIWRSMIRVVAYDLMKITAMLLHFYTPNVNIYGVNVTSYFHLLTFCNSVYACLDHFTTLRQTIMDQNHHFARHWQHVEYYLHFAMVCANCYRIRFWLRYVYVRHFIWISSVWTRVNRINDNQ